MLRKANPKKATACYFEMVLFYSALYLRTSSLFPASPQTQQPTYNISITQPNAGPYSPFPAQMSLLYRTGHAQILGECSLSTDSVNWFRMIPRMSSDNFPKSIKGLVCVTQKEGCFCDA
jgi:hypothetical protein